MTPWARRGCIIACGLLLGWAWAAAGHPVLAPWIILAGLLWIFLGGRWAPMAYLGLVLALSAAAVGMLLRVSPPLLLLASIFALAAWDLDYLGQRLSLAARQDDLRGLETRHYVKLGGVLACAAALGLAADLVPGVHITFEVAAGLAILAAWGLAYLVVRLRKAR
jgi:hypothetical protein